MVSGSAPLPVTVFRKWEEISGHRILERYGMTEIGMCLSNEYHSKREPGYVGVPLPGVRIKLTAPKDDGSFEDILECFNDNNNIKISRFTNFEKKELIGEIFVKGDGVFKEYFKNPTATKNSFTKDGWFRTGDTAKYNINKRIFKLLGRTSVDIIKTGGYKVSALEIETHLLSHPDIDDCAVVGVDDPEWGQRVAAIIAMKEGKEIDLQTLREYCKQKVAEYAVPTILKVVDNIPKNVLSKVNKVDLTRQLFYEENKEVSQSLGIF